MESEVSNFRDRLFAAGLLVPTGHDGIYLRSHTFERVIRGIDSMVSQAGRDLEPTTFHLPMLVSRSLLEQSDYLRSFPDLIGAVSTFQGGDAEHSAMLNDLDGGKDWTTHLDVGDLALCSAGCHPLYPTLDPLIPLSGSYYEVFGQCFRHEPSIDPARMQTFRQHEFVYVGDEAGARKHRDTWVERGLELHHSLGLDVEAVVANDPFFGRAGRLLASDQRNEALKIEIVAPVASSEHRTAITSANCHLDHFGRAFGLRQEGEVTAHSACVGFGVERVALALFAAHGLDIGSWPRSVTASLEL